MLKCDFGNLHREVELLEAAGAALLHLDVMDGHFVPNLSYGPMVIERLRSLTALPFDAHLMISRPERYVDAYVAAGCEMITIHVEATEEPQAILDRVHNAGRLAGVAINPETPVAAIEALLPACDLVLVMSVSPGFGGQRFQPGSLDKLRDLRDRVGAETLLSIDGGIGPETIDAAMRAGADVAVVGSAIFDTQDYNAAMSSLASSARAAHPGTRMGRG